MNKLYLSYALIAIFALPAFADIDKNASTATCDSATIGATSGAAYMDTDWTANTINLDFYSDGEKISTGSCTYDGAIELPEDPEDKTGYTFGGWQLRRAAAAPQCDLSGIDISENGSAYAYIRFNGSQSKAKSDGTRKTPDTYNITENGEWVTEFSYGVVKGVSRCSKVGTGYVHGQTGEPTDDTNQSGAKYCWCQTSGFDANKDGQYCSVSSLWMFNYFGEPNTNTCATYCTDYCGSNVRNNRAIRVHLLGEITQ